MSLTDLFTVDCPTCGARVGIQHVERHAAWHREHGDECDAIDGPAWGAP